MFEELQSFAQNSQLSIPQSLLLSETPIFLQHSIPIDDQVALDITSCEQLLSSLTQGQQQLLRKVQRLKQEYSGANFNSGISYFDTKNMLMTQYLIELHFYVLFKLNGVSLIEGKGLELYKNLIYLKTLMMKLGPVEKKLEYKTQKILREGVRSFANSERQKQAITLKPNPRNLVEERTTDNTQTKTKKYIVPKITPALMPEDKQKAKQIRNIERQKQHLKRQLRDNFRDEDQQVETNMISQYDRRILKKHRERLDYEQRNFTRLPETRKDKQELKRLEKMKFNDVGDLSELKQMKNLLKYTGMIEQDYEREQKADKLLQRTKKIHKKTPKI